jgi:chromosome segregation ATPase
VRALFATLPCLLAALLGAAVDEPSPPQNLPIVYDEIGGKFILRIDNRRYQLETSLKDPVARLIADANYQGAKLAHEAYRRAFADQAKVDASVSRLEATAQRLGLATERARLSLDAARQQLAVFRLNPPYDPNQFAFLQEQVLRAQSQLLSAEDQENRARGKLEEGRRTAEPARARAEKARQEYAAALTDYERPLAQLRALALSAGTAL